MRLPPDAETMEVLAALVRDVPDFPQPGIVFKDITPLLADPPAFARMVAALVAPLEGRGISKVLAIEARGFIVAAPVAQSLRAGFVPVRKAGKLPGAVASVEYELEYGSDHVEVHRDAIGPGERVAVVDDVLATGGTAAATVQLARSLGADVVACAFVLELAFLDGRQRLPDLDVISLLTY